MRRILLSLLLTALYSSGFAQCPVASFSLPDTACSGTPLPIINTSTGDGLSFKWDFCPKEQHGLTQYQFYRYSNYTLSTMTDFDLLKAGGQYYMIAMDTISNNLVIGTIGNHLSTRPFDAQTFGSFPKFNCFDFITEGDSAVYGLACYSPTNSLSLLTFPGGILNTPVVTPLSAFPSLSNPADFRLVKNNQTYYAFIANRGNGTVTCLSFGNSMTNAPTELYTYTVAGAGSLTDIDLSLTCSPPVAFLSDALTGDITKLLFSSGLNAPPTSQSYGSTGSTGNKSVNISQEFESYYVYFTDSANKQLKYLQFANNDFNATPTVNTSPTFYFGPNQIESLTDSSITKLVVCDVPSLNFVEQVYIDSCINYYSEAANPDFTYFTTGWNKFSLTVTDTNGYQSVAYDSVYIISGPTANFTFSNNLCFNPADSISFSDLSSSPSGPVTAWLWDFDDGTTSTQQFPFHQFQSPGTYQVKLTITAGCEKDTIIPVTINALPVVNFGATTSCALSPTIFSDSSFSVSGIQTWQWDFGDLTQPSFDQNPVHTYESGNTYVVQLIATANDGCTDTTAQLVVVHSTPQSNFTTTNTCEGDTVQFTNNSVIDDGSPLTYLWDLGFSGVTTQQTDTVFAYPGAGTYPVSLIAYSNQGCSDTLLQNVVVSTPPTVNFSFAATSCQRNPVAFTDATTGNNLYSWFWDFGDGDTSHTQNPVHAYNNAGTFTITLTVSAGNDCSSSLSQTITITPGPAAAFTAANGCEGSNVVFTDSSSVPSGLNITNWSWIFGDGNSASSQNATNTYSLPGNYNAVLQVTADNGCSDTVSHIISIFENPVAGFIIQALQCQNSDIYFLDTSYIGNGFINQWNWQFSNGGSSTFPSPNVIFTSAGPASATLTVTTIDGCSNTHTENFNVRPQPDFTFSYSGICKGQTTAFNYLPNNNISGYAWTWAFGDNNYSFIPNTTHTYANSGTYPISLAVVDSFGCQNVQFDTITIYNRPVVSFMSDGICQNEPVQFINQTNLNNTSILNWLWNFGDGQTSTDSMPLHTFSAPGNYTISLLANAAGGCNDSMQTVINIKPAPQAAFSILPETGAPSNTIQFINNSSGASQYEWDFGDGSAISNVANATHVYADTGSYLVTLTAESIYGCEAQQQQWYDVIIPFTDLWLKALLYSVDDGYLSIQSLISNIGNNSVSSFDLRVTTENKSTFIESAEFNIPSGTEKTYNLKTKIYTGNTLPDYTCVRIVAANGAEDSNPDNNEKCISLNQNETHMSVTPNPVTDNMEIHISQPASSEADITLFDVTGKKVRNLFSGNVSSGYNSFSFGVPYLAKGTYIIELRTTESIQHIQFIKK